MLAAPVVQFKQPSIGIRAVVFPEVLVMVMACGPLPRGGGGSNATENEWLVLENELVLHPMQW